MGGCLWRYWADSSICRWSATCFDCDTDISSELVADISIGLFCAFSCNWNFRLPLRMKILLLIPVFKAADRELKGVLQRSKRYSLYLWNVSRSVNQMRTIWWTLLIHTHLCAFISLNSSSTFIGRPCVLNISNMHPFKPLIVLPSFSGSVCVCFAYSFTPTRTNRLAFTPCESTPVIEFRGVLHFLKLYNLYTRGREAMFVRNSKYATDAGLQQLRIVRRSYHQHAHPLFTTPSKIAVLVNGVRLEDMTS